MNTSNRPEGLNIGYYLELISRRRWLLIAPFCLSLVVGMVVVSVLPRMYEASTLILVQPQSVPEKIVSPVIESDMTSRINTISQQILSRSNLERVIQKFKLFEEPQHAAIINEEKIEILRERIKIQLGRAKGLKDTNSFSISYKDSDPQTAMKVTNGLAAFFIDENLKLREGQAVGTTDFLDSELKLMRSRLEEVEEALRDFRLNNRGQLPDELEGNLRILDRLNTRLNQKEESLRAARTSLLAIETDAAAQVAGLAAKGAKDESSPYKLREKLAEMRLRYTEQHPDIVRLKAMIEKLEAESQAGVDPEKMTRKGTSSVEESGIGKMYIRQRIELSGTIKGLEDDIAKINSSIQLYQQRVEQTSRFGQELMNLQRDYDNMRGSYNSLLNRKLEAEISVNMEKKQKGEQFMVIDLARAPEKPISPDLPKLFRIALMAGLGLGLGLIFLLEIMDGSVRRLDRLEEEIGLPVLALVPRIFNPRDRNRHRLKMAATTLSIFIALALIAVFGLMVLKGLQSPLELVDLLGRLPIV